MITIYKPASELFDSVNRQFIYTDPATARFEYSLKAVYEWESRWGKPFLPQLERFINGEHDSPEALDFYKEMAIDVIDDDFLSNDVIEQLLKYINSPSTATTFTTPNNGGGSVKKGKVNTSEEIYASMFAAGVPLEFENRNLNRLLVILKIIALSSEPPKKMSREDVLRQNASLNAQRKAMLKSKG